MEAIVQLIKELKRSDWGNEDHTYNGVTMKESTNFYRQKMDSLYTDAIAELVSIDSDKYGLIAKLSFEAIEIQDQFEVPTDKLLEGLMNDFNRNPKVKGLKYDYEYLCFVRNCIRIQKEYLSKFDSALRNNTDITQVVKEVPLENANEDASANKSESVIKGIKGLATHLRIGTTKAQAILNSEVLQENGIAYRVGKGWNFDTMKLKQFLSNNPDILYNRNK